MRLVGAVALFLLVVVGSGCGGSDKREDFTINYEGAPLHCVSFGGGYAGTQGGVACDFERWHMENTRRR